METPKNKNSVFFGIFPSSEPAPVPAPVPSPQPAAREQSPLPPPPSQASRYESLSSKVQALEAKIQKMDESEHAAAAKVEGFKGEAQAAQRRAVEFEREIAGLKKIIEDSVRDNRAGRDTVFAAIAQFREDLALQRDRAASPGKIMASPDLPGLNSVSLSVGLLEGRLKNLEAGLANEIKERFLVLDISFGETVRKACMAQETAAGSARRVEKLEERVARLPYLEKRVNSGEEKMERIYDLEALTQSLKLSVEGMEKNLSAAGRESAVISAEHKKIFSDFESLSRQVKHLSALFSQLRTELAFLMPKKQESIGE